MRGLAPSRDDFRAVRPLMALQQEPRARRLEMVASAFDGMEPDSGDLETAVLRDLTWIVSFLDDIAIRDSLDAGTDHLEPARDALLKYLREAAPGANREWLKDDPWTQPLRHAYLTRVDCLPVRALIGLVNPLFQLGSVLFHPDDECRLARLAPHVFLEELDWACLEIPDLEDSLLPIRVLVMDAVEAYGPAPEAETVNPQPTGEPTMSDDTKNDEITQADETAELRPERLGQAEKLRPERLGQTEKLRPERLGEPLSAQEIEEHSAKLPGGWQLSEEGDRLILERHFPTVLAAAGFVIQVVEVGTAAGYVPEVRLHNLEVEVGVASSVHGKLTGYDFKLARQFHPA